MIAVVDAEAMMAEAEASSESVPVAESVPVSAPVSAAESVPVSESAPESVPVSESVPASEAVTVSGSEPALEFADADDEDDVVVEATMSETSDWDEELSAEVSAELSAEVLAEAEAGPAAEAEQERDFDSEYAFEHGIAAEPQVGKPVPIPSMAAPPEAPPAPPTLRLAEPPEGLTRPSLTQVEEALFSTDGEVSDVHTTGLFAYENELPIPSRPPLPDLNRPASVRPVEAAGDYDVEESDPPEANDD